MTAAQMSDRIYRRNLEGGLSPTLARRLADQSIQRLIAGKPRDPALVAAPEDEAEYVAREESKS